MSYNRRTKSLQAYIYKNIFTRPASIKSFVDIFYVQLNLYESFQLTA